MPDITMCSQCDCPKRNGCHRYTVRPDQHRQSYFADDPRGNSANGDCQYYWPNERATAETTINDL